MLNVYKKKLWIRCFAIPPTLTYCIFQMSSFRKHWYQIKISKLIQVKISIHHWFQILETRNYRKTRMHSSRMRTVLCSGRLAGCLPGGVWLEGVTPPRTQCTPSVGRHSHRPRDRHPQTQRQTPPPVDRILDTRLWKHNLSATTFRKNCKKWQCGLIESDRWIRFKIHLFIVCNAHQYFFRSRKFQLLK